LASGEGAFLTALDLLSNFSKAARVAAWLAILALLETGSDMMIPYE
jgi:hypothetical protein